MGDAERKLLNQFVVKAAVIIAAVPPQSNERDKVAALNQKFRLNRKESKMLIKSLKRQPI